MDVDIMNCLPQQGDLKHALIGQLSTFLDDVAGWTMHLGTSSMRYDAIGAELVATTRDPHMGRTPSRFTEIRIESLGEVQLFQTILRGGQSR